MTRRLLRHRRGATAIEFAVVASVVFAIFIGMLALALGYWTRNALEAAASDAARCVAINASQCASVTTGCDSATAAICYAETSAREHGIAGVNAADVTTSTSVTYGGQSFTSVTIAYPWSFIGYTFSISVSAAFPNVS